MMLAMTVMMITIKMAIILPTGQWYAPSAVINDPWYCMVLHGIAWYYMVLNGIAPISSQHMSPVIVFDKAVVAQKVKVLCCYQGPV